MYYYAVTSHLVEGATILSDSVQLPAKSRERAAVRTVGVGRAVGVRARGVHGGMDHEGCPVELLAPAAFFRLHVAFVVDEHEVRWLNDLEIPALIAKKCRVSDVFFSMSMRRVIVYARRG